MGSGGQNDRNNGFFSGALRQKWKRVAGVAVAALGIGGAVLFLGGDETGPNDETDTPANDKPVFPIEMPSEPSISAGLERTFGDSLAPAVEKAVPQDITPVVDEDLNDMEDLSASREELSQVAKDWGYFIFNGRENFEQNKVLAHEIFERSYAMNKNAQAAHDLGYLHLHGLGSVKTDYGRALDYFAVAAQAGHRLVWNKLEYMDKHDLGDQSRVKTLRALQDGSQTLTQTASKTVSLNRVPVP